MLFMIILRNMSFYGISFLFFMLNINVSIKQILLEIAIKIAKNMETHFGNKMWIKLMLNVRYILYVLNLSCIFGWQLTLNQSGKFERDQTQTPSRGT